MKINENKIQLHKSLLFHILRTDDVPTVCNSYFTFVELGGCCNRLIMNLSGGFFIVLDDEQEVKGSEGKNGCAGDSGGDDGDNKITSGDDGFSIEFVKSSII